MEVVDRKTKTIPQQLQSYSIKQFKASVDTDKQVRKAPTPPSMDKDQEIARLRKKLALLKVQKGQAVAESTETKQAASGGAKVSRERGKVEVVERTSSAEKQPKPKSPVLEVVSTERLDRRLSPSQTDTDSDSLTTVITVDEGRRRRSSAQTSTSRSSTDWINRRREPRYHSPRTSTDAGRRDLYVVQVTEPQSRTRKGSKEVTRYKEVTVYHKEARCTAVH
jgi:hypothetical protein